MEAEPLFTNKERKERRGYKGNLLNKNT